MTRLLPIGVLSVLLALPPPTPGAQSPASPEAPATSGPDTAAGPRVRIDAVVTDRRGRPVRDLAASDFEVRVRGVVQPLAAGELRRARPSRVFAFLLDEFHVSAGSPAHAVRDAIDRFIAEQMRPGDRAVVLKPLEPFTAIRLTDDRDVLRAAASSFAGRKGDFTPRTEFEEDFIGHAPGVVEAARARIVTVALTEIAMQLGDATADRAAIVLVSDGFSRTSASRRARVPDLQGVVRAASRHHFAVYAFSPARAALGEVDDGAATLDWLAAQTGGVSPPAGTPLAVGLSQMAADLDGAYSLTLASAPADGRFHPVEVRATRPGTEVRARPGYWAPLSAELRTSLSRAGTPARPLRVLRRSALIDAWVGLRPGEEGAASLVMSWAPVSRPDTPRTRQRAGRVQVLARTGEGVPVFDGELARSDGADPAPTRFEAPAGRLELDLRVFAEDGTLLDTETRDVAVPGAAPAAPVMLTPEIIRTRTLREFREASANLGVPSTTSRSFSRTERLFIRVPVWPGRGTDATIVLRVLNRGGQPIRSVERLPGSAEGLALFDLSLAWLAPGQYYLDFTARNAQGAVRERVAVRITG